MQVCSYISMLKSEIFLNTFFGRFWLFIAAVWFLFIQFRIAEYWVLWINNSHKCCCYISLWVISHDSNKRILEYSIKYFCMILLV